MRRTCPICKKDYFGYPAISRLDNCTAICPECGSRQALKAMGLSEEEINKIVASIGDFSSKKIYEKNTNNL